jgi:ABC-2 type transport system permease protein
VDNETDTQQMVLPISVPLILAILSMTAVVENPDSNLAVVLSYIPLTSPVIMMARIPFGVPWWQIGLSMVFLVGFFVLAAWVAGRIYRVGILRYGKKYNLREVIKWFSYKV